MTSLYKRASPQQRRIFRAVEGAVKNALDAHPGQAVKVNFARSIAKRAAGTLTAQWPDVLAARSASSDQPRVSTGFQGSRRLGQLATESGRRASRLVERRSPLPALWREITRMVGPAKRAGQNERAEALIEVLRMIAAIQQKPRA